MSFQFPVWLSTPSMTHKEIEYAASAAAAGWNSKRSSYVETFQNQMAAYVGHKHAFAASSMSLALQMAFTALQLKPGDEVLVPELADVAVASSILHAGGVPVFCDIDPHTLCLSPESTKKRITPSTKGMVPVHMYGYTCNMAALRALAAEHNLFVLEEASQGLSCLCNGHKAGSLGHFSVVGLGEGQLITTGGGAMLLSSHDGLFRHAEKAGRLGRRESIPLTSDFAGCDAAMSHVQASIGTGQMEHIEEIVAHRRLVYQWYAARLNKAPGIRLAGPTPNTHEGGLWPVVYLADPKINRHTLLQQLVANSILASPVPSPLSSMPMFRKANNPVAHTVGIRALVLPFGASLTEEEVDYTAEALQHFTSRNKQSAPPVHLKGWVSDRAVGTQRLLEIKDSGLTLPFTHKGEPYSLRALTMQDLQHDDVIAFLTRMRCENMNVFLTQKRMTEDEVRQIMQNYRSRGFDYVLFFLHRGEERVGHIALDDINFQRRDCVADNVVILPEAGSGAATAATDTLYAWAKEHLGIQRVFNHVLGSNKKVRLLASSQGFVEVNRMPLCKEEQGEKTTYRPLYIAGHTKADDYLVVSVKEL